MILHLHDNILTDITLDNPSMSTCYCATCTLVSYIAGRDTGKSYLQYRLISPPTTKPSTERHTHLQRCGSPVSAPLPLPACLALGKDLRKKEGLHQASNESPSGVGGWGAWCCAGGGGGMRVGPVAGGCPGDQSV